MKKLDLRLKGGLGNQLFQYFAGVHFANRFNRSLRFDLSWYQNVHNFAKETTPRQFELGSYAFSKDCEFIEKIFPNVRMTIDRLLSNIPMNHATWTGFVKEMDSTNSLANRNYRTEGYWIGKKFLPSVHTLQELLISQLKEPSINFLNLTAEMESTKPIVLHIRLGDYRNFPDVFGVCNVDYYLEALRQLEIQGKDVGQVWLFSDEPDLANQIIDKQIDITKTITFDKIKKPSEILALMSKASALIASNSTLSWWAGYLNTNPGSKIVFPAYYMVDKETKDTDLYVESWLYL